MAEENIQGTTPENTPSDTMDTFIESITDNAQKKAFRETLNEDGSFSREKIRDLAGRYLSERRAVSKLNEMPETAEKFKESYKPDDKFAPLFNEENEGGKKVRDMFDKLDKMCMENTIGETKNKAIKNFLLNTLAENGIIDTKTAEEKAADEEKKAEDQRMIMESALGKNTDLDKVNAIIDEFIADESDEDPDVKVVLDAIKSSAKGKLILYSLRNRIYGKPVPVMKTEIGTSQKALEKEYNDPNTSRERRAEIAEKLNEMEGIE